MPDLHERVTAALDEIKDPCSLAAGTPLGLAEMGLVKEIRIGVDGAVAVNLRLTSPFCHMIGFFKTEAIARIGRLPGVVSVTLSPTTVLTGVRVTSVQRRRSGASYTCSGWRRQPPSSLNYQSWRVG